MTTFDTDFHYSIDDLEVKVSELLIATPDMTDPAIDPAVHKILGLMRDQQGMEAGFAAEVLDGKRVFRRMRDSDRAQFIDEDADPLALVFCKRVLKTQVPSGCYVSAPIVLRDSIVYGTLYAFSFNPDAALEQRDLKKLEMAAQLAARMIDERRPASAAAAAA